MNRNVENHFAQLPHVDIERSVLDMSHEVKTSFNSGRLIPFDWFEVLPGDTWQITSSKVVRSQTMLTPVMDNMYLDTYWFFVPSRLVWDHFEEFMGANKTSAWIPQVEYKVPTISSPQGGFALNSIADYMGYSAGYGVEWSNNDELAPSVLPIRCYAKICDDWFRAETVSDPLNIPTGDANQTGTNGDNYINDVANGGMPFKVAKFHDYFTSCLPSPLRSDTPVTMGADPVVNASKFPVKSFADNIPASQINSNPIRIAYPDGTITDTGASPHVIYATAGSGENGRSLAWSTNGNPVVSPTGTQENFQFANLYADPTNAISVSGVSFTINELRLAFQLQKFYEKAARAGSGRYIEILKEHFGVTSPDARLQRSEYLGGNRIPLNVHEVTNNAQSELDFLGDLGAKSATSDIHDDVEWSSTEHGYIIGVMCIRTDKTYPQGMRRALFRKKFSDFYWPVFANIGEQPVYDAEIYASSETIQHASVFGYQEAYADYRFSVSSCTSEMRPGVSNTLASWHFADYYSQKPVLSDEWMREDPANIDRTLAVTSSVSNQFFADIYLKKTATRPMPVYSVPGLIDHH